MRMYKCKCQFKYRLKKSILRNTFQILQERLRNSRTRQSPNQRLEQTSYSQILADVERLRTKLLQLENQYPQPWNTFFVTELSEGLKLIVDNW